MAKRFQRIAPSLAGVDAAGIEAFISRVDAEVGDGVVRGHRGDADDQGDAPRHASLHLDEGVPAADGEPAPPPRGVELDLAIAADRVVDRDDEWDPATHCEETPPQALVVVDDVEVARAAAQDPRAVAALAAAGTSFMYQDTPEFERFVQADAREMAAVVNRIGKVD